MKKSFDLYGIANGDLEAAKEIIDDALGIQFKPHESSHIGNYYRFEKPYGEHVILQNNYDEAENEWFEEQYKQANLILYVNQPSDPESVKAKLIAIPGVSFLRRQESWQLLEMNTDIQIIMF